MTSETQNRPAPQMGGSEGTQQGRSQTQQSTLPQASAQQGTDTPAQQQMQATQFRDWASI